MHQCKRYIDFWNGLDYNEPLKISVMVRYVIVLLVCYVFGMLYYIMLLVCNVIAIGVLYRVIGMVSYIMSLVCYWCVILCYWYVMLLVCYVTLC